jgi:hypothetical protein
MICKSSFETGRLNAFQQVMRHWSELHPYNATHTYKLAGPVRQDALQEAIAQTFTQNGLGCVEVLPDGVTYRYQTDPNPEIRMISDVADLESSVQEQVARELNRPFGRPVCQPMRFSVVENDSDSHYLIATYDHWTADSISARMVLRRILGQYCNLEIPDNDRPLDLYPGTYREVFANHLSKTRLGTSALGMFKQWLQNRSAPQVAYSSGTQMAVNYELYPTRSGTPDQLRAFAKSLGATVHDVILAALARSIREFLPNRVSKQNRAMLLGTIVDTRGDACENIEESLGTFLSYYAVQAACDKNTSLVALTRQIADRTRPIKQRRSYLNSFVNMRFINEIWSHINPATRPHFMRKVIPMAAGVTNVCLRNTWMNQAAAANQILDYSRGAPTGPSLPLTLSPTTVGHEMNVGVTYRTAGFSSQKMNGIMQMLLDQLEHPQTPTKRHSMTAKSAERQLAAV